MKALWPDCLRRPHIAAALGPHASAEGPHKAWPIPARVDRAPLARGRVLFVGDAAAATDPMTGEGIGQALLTGRLAGRGDRRRRRAATGQSPRRRTSGPWPVQLVADHRMSRARSVGS